METENFLLDVEQVAELLNCSVRHVYRLVDSGKMPRPVRLGTLCRWPHEAIEKWIAAGCEPASQE
jgi:excisionase family DNA binding protein